MNTKQYPKLKYFLRIAWQSREAAIWITALVLLASMDISDLSGHASLCPFHALGLGYCPGCGLGRSIALIFNGQFANAWDMHPIGIIAIPLLLWRIISENYFANHKRSEN